jgi:hypothetical protein
MTRTTTELTREQNEALGVFLKHWANSKDSTLEAAQSYIRCVELEMVMCEYVSRRGMHNKLLLIANGKLLPMAQTDLLHLPEGIASTLATLTKPEQERVMRDGIDVVRGHKTVRIAFRNLSPVDLKLAFDTRGGRGRIVTPEEQAARFLPPPNQHDQVIELRLDLAEAKDLFAAAYAEGKSPATLIKGLLREKGYIKRPAVGDAGKPVEEPDTGNSDHMLVAGK